FFAVLAGKLFHHTRHEGFHGPCTSLFILDNLLRGFLSRSNSCVEDLHLRRIKLKNHSAVRLGIPLDVGIGRIRIDEISSTDNFAVGPCPCLPRPFALCLFEPCLVPL